MEHWETSLSFKFMYWIDWFKRQLLHCNSIINTVLHWYLENPSKLVLSSEPRHRQSGSSDWCSCTQETQIQMDMAPLMEQTLYRNWRHSIGAFYTAMPHTKALGHSITPCSASQKGKLDRNKIHRQLHQANLSFWLLASTNHPLTNRCAF